MVDVAKKITGEVQIDKNTLTQIENEVKNISDFKKKFEASLNKNDITEIVSVILGSAIVLEASDIHIEPEEERAKLTSVLRHMTDAVLLVNSDGKVILTSPNVRSGNSVTFTVTNVTHSTLTYDSTQNEDLDVPRDSNGTTITVAR